MAFVRGSKNVGSLGQYDADFVGGRSLDRAHKLVDGYDAQGLKVLQCTTAMLRLATRV